VVVCVVFLMCNVIWVQVCVSDSDLLGYCNRVKMLVREVRF
jgi:hypothetical protein